MPSIERYIFSGHESFPCKTLWLKKGYDFIDGKNNFNAADSVVKLGVGKNMVASIRYWLKTFGLVKEGSLTEVARFVFADNSGMDPYIEDLGTIWLLHYLLISSREATLYNLLFTRFQRERRVFERQHIISFVKRYMAEKGKLKTYNENTVKKDVAVLLQNYVQPMKAQAMEDYSTLLIDLDLIMTTDGKQYMFNQEGKRQLPPDILMYAILEEKKSDKSVDYDTLQNIGLMFCLNDMELIAALSLLQERYPDVIRYSDTAGLRQVQFLKKVESMDVLRQYYQNEKF
jgi:hypothetical protein|uniref:DUF4007 family protein n=1 Tax=Candidatus Cryptobacteroides bacterium TaxID=3085639 RepID=UPI004029FFA3